jgi:hypothetical protein
MHLIMPTCDLNREQYCINDKEAAVLDRRKRRGLLGCFSDHQVRIPAPCLSPESINTYTEQKTDRKLHVQKCVNLHIRFYLFTLRGGFMLSIPFLAVLYVICPLFSPIPSKLYHSPFPADAHRRKIKSTH